MRTFGLRANSALEGIDRYEEPFPGSPPLPCARVPWVHNI